MDIILGVRLDSNTLQKLASNLGQFEISHSKPYIYIGCVVSYPKENFKSFKAFHLCSHKKGLKELLEPNGLWNEEDFGLWINSEGV